MVDISRLTSGVSLPSELSTEIWANTIEQSVVMQAARQIELPGGGKTIHSITGDPVAQWVAESATKPTDRPTLANKAITPYKLAVIVPFSDEFIRDLDALYSEIVRRLPGALGKRFDETAFGAVAAPGANFDQLSATTNTVTVDGTNTLQDLVTAYQTAVAAGGDVSHWLASPALAGFLLSAQAGTQGFDLSSTTQIGSVFGAPVLKTRAAMAASTTVGDLIGFAGDFANEAVWGSVEGVKISASNQAVLTDGANPDIYLFEQNMTAVRAEIEIGFRVRDVQHFVEITDGVVDTP